MPLLAALAAGVCVVLLAIGTTNAQSTSATDVDVRVWQRVTDDARLAVSVRPQGRTWEDMGTVSLDMSGLSSRRTFRYGDIATDGVEVRVWQRVTNHRSLFISARPVGGSWADMGTIPLDMSGETSNGRWRYGDITLAVPPPPPMGELEVPPGGIQLSAGTDHTCLRRDPGQVTCWGRSGFPHTDVPAGRYRSVDMAGQFVCGLLISGEVVCWGYERSATEVPPGHYRSVSAGGEWGTDFTCGVRESGSLACWGENQHGQLDAPSGRYRSVSAGWNHACALRESGRSTAGAATPADNRTPHREVPHAELGRIPHMCCERVAFRALLGNQERRSERTTFRALSRGELRPWSRLWRGRIRRPRLLGLQRLWPD